MLCLGVFLDCSFGQENADNITAVYIVTLKQAPTSHYYGELRVKHGHHIKRNGSEGMNRLDKPRYNLTKTLSESSIFCFQISNASSKFLDFGIIFSFVLFISPYC